MRVWLALGGSVLLFVACRQPNPDWEGPDGGGDASTGTNPEPTSGVPMTTAPVDPSTEGSSCQNDNQCPDGWVCGPMGCQRGGDGDPCDGNGDCMMPTGLCGPDGTCQAGEAGDPCSGPSDCASGMMCTNDVCGGGGSSTSSGSGSGGSMDQG